MTTGVRKTPSRARRTPAGSTPAPGITPRGAEEKTMDTNRYETGADIRITLTDYVGNDCSGVTMQADLDRSDLTDEQYEEQRAEQVAVAMRDYRNAVVNAIACEFPEAGIEYKTRPGVGRDTVAVDIDEDHMDANYDHELERKVEDDVGRIKGEVWSTGLFW
jgi:hypothetical protein